MSRHVRHIAASVLSLLLAVSGARAEGPATLGPETGLALPRFVSLKASEVNLRAGPGKRYPVEWVYQRRHLPVEITAEFDRWRRVRDHEGTTGWVHHSMLAGRRTVLVVGGVRTLFAEPDAASRPQARLEPGALGRLETCAGTWCLVEFAGIDGWLRRTDVFGLYPDEEVQ